MAYPFLPICHHIDRTILPQQIFRKMVIRSSSLVNAQTSNFLSGQYSAIYHYIKHLGIILQHFYKLFYMRSFLTFFPLVFSMQERSFNHLSERNSRCSNDLNFKHLWIWSKGGVQAKLGIFIYFLQYFLVTPPLNHIP